MSLDMRIRCFLAALVTAALSAGGAEAQRGGPPPAPNPLGQPLLDPQGHVKEDVFYQVPLAPEDRKYADIDGLKMKAVLREAAAISRRDKASGTLFWGRNVGFKGHDETQDWVEGYFKKHGLKDIKRKPHDLPPQWSAKSYEITFASGGSPVVLRSARPAEDSHSTPAAGLEYELAWVGMGSDADYIGKDVKGRAVLIHDIPTPGVLRHTITSEGAVQRAFDKGAAAVGMVYGISDNMTLWENRTAGKPGFCVGYEDGMKLRELIGKGQKVTVKLKLEAEEKAGLKTASVLGTLPGTTDEDIIIIAHMDGYFDGAIDNGSGLGVMMGLLEHFSKVPQSERKRNIRFIGSAGHHGGPGARWLHDEREKELAKTALMINLEHVAAVRTKYWGPKLRKTNSVSPMRWWVWGSPKLLDIALKSFARFNVGLTADMDTGASGEMGQVARDAPSMQVITSPEVKHTEEDTEEWVPAEGLEQVGRAYAKIIDEVNRLSINELRAPSSTTATRP